MLIYFCYLPNRFKKSHKNEGVCQLKAFFLTTLLLLLGTQ
jgi:hypothetical protein